MNKPADGGNQDEVSNESDEDANMDVSKFESRKKNKEEREKRKLEIAEMKKTGGDQIMKSEVTR